MSEQKKLLNINEAAEALGLGRSMTYKLIQSGELASIKVGRSRRIPLASLEQFVTQKVYQAVQEQGQGERP